MASNDAFWGIDIGQCALKALRCRISQDDKTRLVADAFDYVEYPQILNQPDVDPVQLVRDALKTFLSRNKTKGDGVAISVSGQNGLARFIKLPPVEAKKIPDIVKYEAKQQIPFKLEEVVWDYQQMPGAAVQEGFALESEVGLFAMKRDQVFRAIKPLEEVGMEVSVIQLTPLAIFNYVAFDLLGDRPADYDSENPPDWTLILSIGTDTSDLVATNGFRVWQRSIPLGGNHFTKALTKQLKLTFAKAEHLKRNANAAKPEDAKALFKAMRPVFGDLLTEVQTSIRYFRMNVDKSAKIGKIVALGNAMKLPGLRRFLSQNLEMDVAQIDAFGRLSGGSVVSAPAFKENLLSFPVCYGLAVQGLGRAMLKTNLVPKEINTARAIKEKKPWALAAAAMLMLGFTISYFGDVKSWASARWADDPTAFQALVKTKEWDANKSSFDKANADLADLNNVHQRLIRNVDGRLLLPELLKAINASLPPYSDGGDADKSGKPLGVYGTEDDLEGNINDRRHLQITSFHLVPFDDRSKWFNSAVQKAYREANPEDKSVAESGEAPPAAAGDGGESPPADSTGGGAESPKQRGWVVEIEGVHYRNSDPADQGRAYVQKTLVKRLQQGKVELLGAKGEKQLVSIRDLGVQYPTLVYTSDIKEVLNPAFPSDSDEKQPERINQFKFVLQFWWEETPLTKRLLQEKEKNSGDKGASVASADGRKEN